MPSARKIRSVTWRLLYCMFCLAMLTAFRYKTLAGTGYAFGDPGSRSSGGTVNEEARGSVINENFSQAITAYSQMLLKDSANLSLNAEYAYALALGGIYDAALIRLDKIWSSRGDNTDIHYFTSQVMALMGMDELAVEFEVTEKAVSPEWVSSKAPELLKKYQRDITLSDKISPDDLVNQFKRANRLTAQNYTLQSVALFEEITSQYPAEYLPYVGYSIALEKAGMLRKAAQAIENALTVIGDNPEQSDIKKSLESRLLKLKTATGAEESGSKQAAAPKQETLSPQMMAYAGGYLSSAYSSLNTRFGYFLSKDTYASVDLGMTQSAGGTFGNLGFTVYNRQKIFVMGIGITGSFGEGNSVAYTKISVGPSFMNKKGTASFDIFLDGKAPLKKGYATTMGISIGRSMYFGKRK